MTTNLPIIEVEGLGKRYDYGIIDAKFLRRSIRRGWGNGDNEEGRFWALKDISFSVNPGEIVGLIGHNGAGKSTLLKVLSRITEPTEGRAVLRGKLASLLEVGTGFHPELSGRDNVFLNGSILGMTRKEVAEKYDRIVEFAEMERFMETPTKRYSSGMRVRLAFSVAAHLDPDIMLIDEVLAVGDARFQAKCLNKMGEVSGEGRTIIFVSHQMHLIQNLCTRCLEMDGGQIVADGDTATVVEDYYRRQTMLGEGEAYRGEEAEGPVALLFAETRSAADGQACAQFMVEEPLCIHSEWDFKDHIEGLRVAFRVRNEVGQVIFATSTHDQHLVLGADKRFSLDALIDRSHLLPGKYTVDITARSTNSAALVDLTQVLTFRVIRAMYHEERPAIATGRKGFVYCAPNWTQRPL